MSRVVYYDVNEYSKILNYCIIEYEDSFVFIAEDKCIAESISYSEEEELNAKIKKISDADKVINGLYNLRNFLRVSEELSVFQMYIQHFGFGSNSKDITYIEMVKDLIIDNLGVNLKTGGLIMAIHKSKKTIRITACWFMILMDGSCKSLGEDDFYFRENDYLYSHLEKLKLSISKDIVSSGLSLENLRSFIFSENDKVLLETLFKIGGSTLPKWLQCQPLQGVLADSIGLSKSTSFKTLEIIYTHSQNECNNSAKNLCRFLESSGKRLKLDLNENGLIFNREMQKNFCNDIFSERHRRTQDYGIILDCEGTENGGCREIGIIIFFKDNNRMFLLEEYKGEERNLHHVLASMYKDYSKFIERYIPQSGIPTYVYGVNDKDRILQSLGGRSLRSARREFEKKLSFIDIQPNIKKYLRKRQITPEGYKLKEVAESLNVVCAMPVHDPLCDCRTLFNVMAMLLLLDNNILNRR